MSELPVRSQKEEIEAIFERLRDEVRRSGRRDPGSAEKGAGLATMLEARAEAESLWSVTFEQRISRRPGLRDLFAYPAKLFLRRAMRWYVEPYAGMQRQFNLAALKLVDELAARVAELEERRAQGEAQTPAR
jgi:hypothetical protein